MKQQRLTAILVPTLLALLYLFLLVWRADRVPLTDDARFYLDAGKQYATWFDSGITSGNLFKPNVIDRYWRTNHEHPPFAKLLMAAGYLTGHKWTGITDEIKAQRYAISLFAVLILLFLFDFTRRAFSFEAALFASLFFILLPRTFFHARVATLDFAVAGTSFLFVYAYWRGYESRLWAWLTGPLFGIALATKLNAPFMVVPVVIHFAVLRRKRILHGDLKALFIPQFVSMLLFALPLFFLLWPWMWHHTVDRFMEYVSFHVKHYGILMYYLGSVYSAPRPPWSAPLVMMLITTPILTLYSAGLSVVLYPKSNHKRHHFPFTLVVLSAAVSLAALMFLPAPFYSGVKLFQPLFPFLAIMGGIGMAETMKHIRFSPRVVYPIFLLFFVPILITMVRLDGAGLSFYNDAVGGTKGALRYRMERHYYDLFYPELIDWFNKRPERRFSVVFEPNGKEYQQSARILKEAGILKKSFIYGTLSNCDYLVLTHEYRWKQYPALLRRFRHMRVVFEVRREGVPLLTVYENGTDYEGRR